MPSPPSKPPGALRSKLAAIGRGLRNLLGMRPKQGPPLRAKMPPVPRIRKFTLDP